MGVRGSCGFCDLGFSVADSGDRGGAVGWFGFGVLGVVMGFGV